MEYLTTIEMSKKWGITARRIAVLCEQGRIVGVEKKGKTWLIPYDSEKPIGFLCLKETGKETVELCVMGVLKDYHRKGVGRKLFEQAREKAKEAGYSFMQVKTVQMGRYEDYDATNHFYLSLGFKEFEVFPTLWDEWNPCQIYVMTL